MMRRAAATWGVIVDFVVGDDWRVSVAVGLAIGLTAVVAVAGVTAWWILPVAVAGILVTTLWGAALPPDR